MKKILIVTVLTFFNSSHAEMIKNKNLSEIIIESQKKYTDIGGKPLPLAASGTGEIIDVYPHNRDKGSFFSPKEQIEILKKGHHFLPTLGMYSYRSKALSKNYYFPFLKQLKKWGLPFTISTTQWEQDLYLDENYFKLSKEENPNLVHVNGKIEKKLSPFGPNSKWYNLGEQWALKTKLVQIQKLYPNPPTVIWLSNNEANHLQFYEANKSQRFIKSFGKNASTALKKEVFHNQWEKKYLTFQSAIKNNLQSNSWRDRLKFVGYNVDAVNPFGRWHDWTRYNHFVKDKIGFANEYSYWDGGAVEYYLNPWAHSLTDFTVFSPQIEYMNVQMSLNEIRKSKPNYWFEMFIWDGFEPNHLNNPLKNKRDFFASLGQKYSPERYKGWLQFGMWLTQPRVVREFRSWEESRESVGVEYFEQVLDAVDIIYENPTLKRFWRNGELVINSKSKHPYQVNIPNLYKHTQRWYLLDTNLDPQKPWSLKTELPVFSLARVIKKGKGKKEWLIYAHSPTGKKQNVTIKIPDGKGKYLHEVSQDIPIEGIFIHINSDNKIVTF